MPKPNIPQLQEAALSATIDFTATPTTDVYEVPADYDFFLDDLLLLTDSCSDDGDGPTHRLGNSSDDDAYMTDRVSRADVANTTDRAFIPGVRVPAGTTIQHTISSAATHTTHTGRVILIGRLQP